MFTANWKVTNIDCVLDYLYEACPDLIGISLAGWKEFTGDQLAFLVEQFKSLKRIDLSSVNVSNEKTTNSGMVLLIALPHFPQLELNPNRSAVGTQSLCSAIQTLGSRLTHLYLAHNRLAGIPQIVVALSVIVTLVVYAHSAANRCLLFAFLDALSQFDPFRFVKCKYGGCVAWCTSH